MDIAVVGATGAMGGRIADRLEQRGHAVRRLSRSAGVDAMDVGSLVEAFAGADVAVDASNRMTLSGKAAERYFTTVATNVVRAAERSDVRRVACVGIWGASDPAVHRIYGYYRGKAAQEAVYRRASLPTTMVLSAQWFELVPMMLGMTSLGPIALPPTMLMAPVAADRVAERIVAGLEREDDGKDRDLVIGGPEQMTVAEAARRWIAERGDIDGARPRVIRELPYFGSTVAHGALVPTGGEQDDLVLEEWLRQRK